MGYLDMMLGDNEPKKFQADGKNYTFVPGKNGSLTASLINPPAESGLKTLEQPYVKKAKVIMPPKSVDVGSSRG